MNALNVLFLGHVHDNGNKTETFVLILKELITTTMQWYKLHVARIVM